MKLMVLNSSGKRVPKQWLTRWCRGLSKALGRKLNRQELVIVFVTKSEMKRLNGQYRNKPYPTDVLSFDSLEPGSLGELVLCMDVIEPQAKRTGLTPRAELGYMVVHGVLHLLGHDHDVKAREKRMFALQDKLFARLIKTVGLR